MKILGIETTCDETACSIVENGKKILSNVIHSQMEHVEYGGVVPALASSLHLKEIDKVAHRALKVSGIGIDDIDAVAVSHGPGLSGAISIGVSFANGVSIATGKKVIYVNHVHAHLYATYMSHDRVDLPCIGVVLSGGHSFIVEIKSFSDYRLFGDCIDDAVGEAFDKVAKMLGLNYPGGPEVEKRAMLGEYLYKFSRCKAPQGKYYFSNSGLKTQVMYAIKEAKKNNYFNDKFKNDICRSFQEVLFKDICIKVSSAINESGIKTVLFGGGVVNSKSLRNYLNYNLNKDVRLLYPKTSLSLDNAAMIAGMAYELKDNDSALNKDIETRIPWK